MKCLFRLRTAHRSHRTSGVGISFAGLAFTRIGKVLAMACFLTAFAGVSHGDVLWNMDFEGSTSLPAGWTQSQITGSATWVIQQGGYTGGSNPSTAHGGTNNATLFKTNTNDNKTRLLTPTFNTGGYTGLSLTFWHAQQLWGSSQDELKVFYSGDGGVNWTQLAHYTNNAWAWTQRTISIPFASTNSRIAFEGNAKYGLGVCLDDIQLTGTPTSTPEVWVSATDASGSEAGQATGTWTITRVGNTTGASSVSFTLSGTATQGSDYTINATSPVNFAAGQTSKVVTLTPVDDTVGGEGVEVATLTLSSASGCTISQASDSIGIIDDEGYDMNVLLIGCTKDSADNTSMTGTSDPFNPTGIRTQLQSILQGAGLGSVNVTLIDRDTQYSLAAWFHNPLPAGDDVNNRWPNLRGELGTQWDKVILIGDPYTIEYIPGLYAYGAARIATEVAKGTAETVLFMPWPATGSSSTLNHYKEVVYRAGRSGGLKVAPAGLAWQATGSTTNTTRRDFISAASLYSTIWGQSAKQSTYVYDDALADSVHSSVTTQNAAQQYTGNFSFQNPFLMLGDKRRDVHYSEKGTSTEEDYKQGVGRAMQRAMVTYNSGSYNDKYNSDTPADDGLGWPTANPMPIAWNHGRKFAEPEKEYVVNPAYWQIGLGFMYQANTWSLTVDEANDTQISNIFNQDLYLANYMKGQHSTARCIPWRLIWAQIHQEYPTLNPLRDGSGPHVNVDLREAVGTYMYTLYSGRCPLDPQPATMTTDWYAKKIGYETAWKLGRCQSRAPGFKVMPSLATKKSITPGTTETMSVQFILPPKNDVTVNVSLSTSSAAIVGPQKLVFTPTNYNVPQQVVINGLAGPLASETFNVVFDTVSTDEVCNGLQDTWEYSITRSATQAATYSSVASNTATTYKNIGVTIPINVAGASSSNTVLAGPGHGTLTWSGSNVVYNPAAGYYGIDGFAYAVNSGGVITRGYTEITVINAIPDKLITIAATDADASETGPNTGTLTFTRTGSTAATLTVDYTVSGTAVAGSDYTALATSVTFPIGASTVTRTVTPINDSEFETAETVILTLTPSANYIAAGPPDNSATVTIADNDKPTVTVAVTDAVCGEPSDAGVFTLTRTGTTVAPLTVTYTMGGAALNGTDYTAVTGSVTFAANASTATVTVSPVNDVDYEGPETATLTISSDASYLSGSPYAATLTVTDNDKPTVSIACNLTSTAEGGANPVLTFSRTGATGVGPQTIYYTVSGTAAMGADYSLLGGTFTIPQGQASASVTVSIVQDAVTEVPETFTVSLSNNAAYTVAGAPANAAGITIVDDTEAAAVVISATDNAASEPAKGDGSGAFTITRGGNTNASITVGYEISGTATEGSDFSTLSGTVTIPAGQTSAIVTISALDDTETEIDETVVLTLRSGTGYTVGTTSSATVNLYDDEPTQVRVEAGDTKCIEGATADNGTFILRRLGNRTAALTVNYTRTGTAVSGTDYTALTGTATINANSGSATVTVTPTNDSLVEGTETVILTLAAGTGYAIHTENSSTLEIRDDEVVDVNVSAQDANCAEQATPDNGNFRITRSATATTPLTVSYTVTGTADNGTDYTLMSGTATIPANATLIDIPLVPTNDGLKEGPESVIITLTGAGSTYDIGDSRSATIWIKDDETPSITLAATDNAAAEADGGTTNQGLWTFTSNIAPTSNLTIAYTVSANNGIDCTLLPGSIVLPAGQTSVTLPLVPFDDELAESAENVGITLADTGNYNLATTNTINVSIAASDTPQATLVAFDPSAVENPVKTGRFLVMFTKAAASNTTVNYTISGSATSGADYTALSGSVNVTAGNNSAIITATPLDDALAEGTESIILTLGTSTAYVVGFPSAASVNIADDENMAPLMVWKQSSFGSEWTDETIAGDASDTDGDGLKNLVEYAFGTDPNLSTDVAGRPQSGVGSGALSLSFTRVLANNDITITIQGADDLGGPWTDLASSTNGAATIPLVAGVGVNESGSGPTRVVSVTDLYATSDPGHPRRFMRISVTP